MKVSVILSKGDLRPKLKQITCRKFPAENDEKFAKKRQDVEDYLKTDPEMEKTDSLGRIFISGSPFQRMEMPPFKVKRD